jgi:hypothetical protein
MESSFRVCALIVQRRLAVNYFSIITEPLDDVFALRLASASASIGSYKLMKSLNPEVVIAGHKQPTTTNIFDEYEGFYNL